jgi:diphthamide synthase subunit DPH2
MIQELDNKKLKNILRTLLTDKNEKDINQLVQELKNVEKYISQIEMDNINLSIKLNTAIDNYCKMKKDASNVIKILKPEINN